MKFLLAKLKEFFLSQPTATQLEEVEFDLTLAERTLKQASRQLPSNLATILPLLQNWVDETIEKSGDGDKVPSEIYDRLKVYFPTKLLEKARVICCSSCPKVPLEEFGISLTATQFPDSSSAAGLTLKDRYFVRYDQMERASLHFHELVHVVQWEILGPQAFIALYTLGLLESGYRKSPLEEMAYKFTEQFEKNRPLNVPLLVKEKLRKIST